ncbi:MAG: Mrp/NBP35 family ATP-binding protein [Phaeovulum sp.]|uniref:Mrp/NBP35 family ATP-binding protein n=1 Tax=Phaeovulum sp. TaxID=2934796 RepID=UPI0027310401|nr:Mrp/NBP35 family ATP-binding protein [Phaeovulum sp.]MDP2063869.1 Mrp/NBP35 family ATP-binding protein [Phaeovulum sp.]MDP3862553.1 Mrp/NBP35 family ATP-binding protein [Phaeovulum sp.]
MAELTMETGVEPIAGVRDIVLVASGKGGVGKSTVSVNLAVALARAGLRTGIVDLDLGGPSVGRLTGAEEVPELRPDGLAVPEQRHGLSVVSMSGMIPPEQALVWKGPLVAQAVAQLFREVAWPDLDVLVVDMPPGTGDVLLSVVEQVPVAGAVVVTTPERMASIDAERAVALFHEHDIPVFGVVRNMADFVCPCCGEVQPLFAPAAAVDVARRMHVADLGAIPADLGAARQAAAGVPIIVAAPEGATAQAFARLAEAVQRSIERERAAQAQNQAGERSIWEIINGG